MRSVMIMAGGSGTRLWPMSRVARPKQLLPFIEGRCLLELAVERLEGLVPPERLTVCTAERFRPLIRRLVPQVADEQILGEPVGRNTVNAVGLTAAILHRDDRDAVFVVATADHLIEPRRELHRALTVGLELVEADPHRLVTFSIRPTEAATCYGYVQRGDPIEGFNDAFRARGFVEKPDPDQARAFLDAGTFGWNSGMFVFHAGTYLEALRRFLPEAHAGLERIAEAWSTPRRAAVLEEVYPQLPSTSVDYGVMEPAAGDDLFEICTVTMDVAWRDVGSWPSYAQTLAADPGGNRTNTGAVHLDSTGVVAVSDDPAHTIATIGCRDLLIIRTADATLVCPTKHAERVKELVDRLGEELK